MAEQLTEQQRQAVFNRGGELLVSAAAGSGKTKVLVDRIMSYLKDSVSPANLDDFLVITYTKAAAAELRGKIAAKLNQEIAAYPGNYHLQKQLQRLYLAKISTVHAFCADLLREHAYHLDIPLDFRVAEENECEEMQRVVIEKMLNEAYRDIHNNSDFGAFVDTQGFGRNDRQLPEIILKLYQNARCHMNPDGWLKWCLEIFDVDTLDDVSDTPWAKYLINDLHHYIDLQMNALRNCIEQAKNAEGMAKPIALLYSTIDQLSALRNCNNWDQIIEKSRIDYGKLSFPRKNFDEDMALRIKAVRDACKAGMQKKLRRFIDSGTRVLADMNSTAAAARGLVVFTQNFAQEYDKCKRHARVLDFSDLEHKTLDLLVGKKRSGPTAIAAEVGHRFREVMVDEYQDSNEVQDAIFSAITDEKRNCFMVGDVKQSIYQFRRADPEIFLEKYNKYVLAEMAQKGEGRKVLLSKNFRSGKGVINAVNDVFTTCMSESVGGLDYGRDEMLYEGIPHGTIGEAEVELYGIAVDETAYHDEAAFVANRVIQLLDGTHMVRDKENLRPITPEDIVILLRSPGSTGYYYVDALERLGIRCCTGNSADLLSTEEVQTLRAILQIIDNPLQDIPLISVLTSKVFRFTANDLASVRSGKKHGCFYDALNADKSTKAQEFISILSSLREQARVSTVIGLIKRVFSLTKLDSIFASMDDGESRVENLLGFYKIATDFDARGGKNLNMFLTHLEALDEKGVAISAEQVGSDAVTIMSIHKSKGLEFPVVILPGLSRKFNTDSAHSSILCDKDLGIGLSCVDVKNRVRYPSVAKHAISSKMLSDGISEEMRVLYVAMTRARDRLIMTFAAKNLEKKLCELSLRLENTDMELLTGEADCPGEWVLLSALKRAEAGAFFAYAMQPKKLTLSDTPWKIALVTDSEQAEAEGMTAQTWERKLSAPEVNRIKSTLGFVYPYAAATKTPSKQTATQIKGREKDAEAAEATLQHRKYAKAFRKPTFFGEHDIGINRGNALHIAMQYIRYSACINTDCVAEEIARLVYEGYITDEQAGLIDPAKIARFFQTELGDKLLKGKEILREFKFSILDDAAKYDPAVTEEKILLQGVVDCALIEDSGIIVVDFKTDRVTVDNLSEVTEQYRPQVLAYASALERIYQKPIKEIALYFFEPEIEVVM